MLDIINSIRIWWRLKRNPAWREFCDSWTEIGLAILFEMAYDKARIKGNNTWLASMPKKG